MLRDLATQGSCLLTLLRETLTANNLLNENLSRVNTNTSTAIGLLGTVIATQATGNAMQISLRDEVRAQRLEMRAQKEAMDALKKDVSKMKDMLEQVTLMLTQRTSAPSTASPATASACNSGLASPRASAPYSALASPRGTMPLQSPVQTSPRVTTQDDRPSLLAAAAPESIDATINPVATPAVLPLLTMPEVSQQPTANVSSTLLRTAVSSKAGPTSAEGLTDAKDLFIWAFSENNGEAPSAGKSQAKLVRKRSLRLFTGLLYPTERSALLQKPAKDADGRQDWDANLKRIAAKIHALAIKFLMTSLKEKGVTSRVDAGMVLKISAIDNYLRKLELTDDQIQRLTDPDKLTAYRKTVEEAEVARKRTPSTTHQAESSTSKRLRAAVPSSHVQHVTTSNCSHGTAHCKATNTPCSQCSLLVCSECALVISGDDVAKGYVCPVHLQDRTCAYHLDTCAATHHKCKKPGCGLPVCSVCATRISFDDPRQGYWCPTHANITSTLSAASNII